MNLIKYSPTPGVGGGGTTPTPNSPPQSGGGGYTIDPNLLNNNFITNPPSKQTDPGSLWGGLKTSAGALAAQLQKLGETEIDYGKDTNQPKWILRGQEDINLGRTVGGAAVDPPQYDYKRKVNIPAIQRERKSDECDLNAMLDELSQRNKITETTTDALIDAMERGQGAELESDEHWEMEHYRSAVQCWNNIVINETASNILRDDIWRLTKILNEFKKSRKKSDNPDLEKIRANGGHKKQRVT